MRIVLFRIKYLNDSRSSSLISLNLQSFDKEPHFTAKMSVQELSLPALRNFMMAYAKVIVESGTFEDFVEVNAEAGHYEGYTKPFFRDLKFKRVPDKDKNVLERAATSAASAVTDLLKNKEGKVATKAPFKGDFNDNKVDVWTTIENLLRNAFIQSLTEGLDAQKSG